MQNSWKLSLDALSKIHFFHLSRHLPPHFFREAYQRLIMADFDAEPSVGGERVLFQMSYYQVVVEPKSFDKTPVIYSDCLEVVCSCKAPMCEHALCAVLALHKLMTRRFEDVRPLARIKLGDLAENFSFFTEEDAGTDMTSIRLEAILFCVHEDNADVKTITKIPPTRPILETEKLSRSRWIQPHDYHRSPFHEPPSWDHVEQQKKSGWGKGLQDGAFEIQYLFSDGAILDSHQIFYHAYGQLIPQDFLPALRDHSQDLLMFTSAGGSAYGFDPERAMLRALEKVKKSFPVRLVLGSCPLHARKALDIRQISFSKSGTCPDLSLAALRIGMEYQDSKVKIHFLWGPEGKSEGLIPFANFLLDPTPSKATLIFHSHAEGILTLIRLVNHFAQDPQDRDVWGSPVQKIDSEHFSGLQLIGHENIDRLLWEIKHDRSLSHIPITVLTRDGKKTPSIKSAKPGLALTTQGDVRYGMLLESEGSTLAALNPGPWGRFLLQGFNSGFQSLLHGDRDRHMVGTYDPRRKNDLTLLSHTGIYALAILEVGEVVKGAVREDECLSVLFPKVASLYEANETEKETEKRDLKKLCSPRAIKSLSAVVEDWLKTLANPKNDTVTLYLNSGPVNLQGYHRTLFLFLAKLVERQALRTNGKCFLKPRKPVFSVRLSPDIENRQIQSFRTREVCFPQTGSPISFEEVAKEDILGAALSLREHGCEIFHDGRSVERLDAENFRAEFSLKEQDGPASDVTGAAGVRMDWFDLHPRFFLNGIEIDGSKVREMSQSGVLEWNGRLYLIEGKKLPSVAYLERFWNRLMSGPQDKQGTSPTENEVYRLPRHQTLELLLLRKQGVQINGGPEWQEVCDFYDSLDGRDCSPLELPVSIRANLKNYQKSGVQWLLDLHRLKLGGILADDMGLGKTLQALAFLEMLRSRSQMGHTLIIVPTSLTYNWIAEGKKFTPDLPLHIFQSKDKNATEDFLKNNTQAGVICTYGLLVEHEDFFRQFSWNIHIYDEVQNLKNITALRTSTSRSLPAKFKLGLTGTPLENHLGEFYSLLDLVVPGCLGDLGDFRKVFVNPMTIDREALANLRLKIRPLVLRRHKSEILKDLPEKTESSIVLPFEDRQKKIYRDIAISWNEKVRESVSHVGEARSQIMMLTALLRLRQACSDPSALPKTRYTQEPPKVSLLIDSLREITESGESALVFTQFLKTFDRIGSKLGAENIPLFSLHGGLSHGQRKKQISEFQSSTKGAVFLMTLKTGGVGLNLTKASYVFHIEPWWNPAVENQATDRTHRIGQTSHVQVYRYLMKESVEEKIEIMKQKKSERFQALFGTVETETDMTNGAKGSGQLSKSDFDYLLGE